MLRARPCEHIAQRDDLVFFAVDDDRVRGNGVDGEATDGGTVRATRVCTKVPNEKPASTGGSDASAGNSFRAWARAARVSSVSPGPSSNVPALLPTPRKLRRTAT
jgi:hypothetical protein